MKEFKELAEELGKGREAVVGKNGEVNLPADKDEEKEKKKEKEKDKDRPDNPPHGCGGDSGHDGGHGNHGGHGGGIIIPPSRTFGGAPPSGCSSDIWNESNKELFDKDLKAMEIYLPSFKADFSSDGRLRRWTGIVKPYGDEDFMLAVLYPLGYPKYMPKAFVLSPNIALLYGGGHPHMYSDGSICVMFPPDKTWLPGRDTIASFIGHCCVWLIGHLYWKAYGTWPLKEVSHEPRHLVSLLDKKNICWCGSGKLYGQCHYKKDKRFSHVVNVPRGRR